MEAVTCFFGAVSKPFGSELRVLDRSASHRIIFIAGGSMSHLRFNVRGIRASLDNQSIVISRHISRLKSANFTQAPYHRKPRYSIILHPQLLSRGFYSSQAPQISP